MTTATLGAVAALRALIVSWPLTMYLSRQGELNGFQVMQFWAISEKPMSLPPMESETALVSAASELNWGGLGPSGSTFCGCVM
jgi:hypothetical protein